MDEYINDDTIVEDDFYNSFKDSVTCPLCLCILINPVMCMKCQNVYCKKCVDDWSKKDKKCPNRCENPNYQKSLVKNDILSKLKIKCKFCQIIIPYNEVQKHKENCILDKMQSYEIIESPTPKPNSDKLKRLSSEEARASKKERDDVAYINSKKIYFIYIIILVITLGDSGVGKSSLIET